MAGPSSWLRGKRGWRSHEGVEVLISPRLSRRQVLTEVMSALCDNLRPAPFHYGTIALRLLGKLGGRNRRFLNESMKLPSSSVTSWNTHDCFKVSRWESVSHVGTQGGRRSGLTVLMRPQMCCYCCC